jgi:uncharacterized protein YccT (UPF0319 family)
MKLSQLSKEPKLIEVVLDDEETVKEFGEPVIFYTWDRQPLDVFMKLANLDTSNTAQLIEAVKGLLLDEEGKEIITKKNTLPMNLMMKSITKVTELLGK